MFFCLSVRQRIIVQKQIISVAGNSALELSVLHYEHKKEPAPNLGGAQKLVWLSATPPH